MDDINFYTKTIARDDYGSRSIVYPIELSMKPIKPGSQYNKTVFCIYTINYEGLLPFLQYLLYKYPEGDTLYFPFIESKASETDFLKKVLKDYKYKIVGKKLFEGKLLVYVNVENEKTELTKHQAKDMWWWSTIDEIVNIKSVLAYKIHKSVVDVFYNNNDMCFLLYGNDEKIYTPSVYYKGGDKIESTYLQMVYGFFRSTVWNGLGPFYSFSSYDSALPLSIKYTAYIGDQGNTKSKTGGIIRLVAFNNNMKVFLNSISDKENKFSDVELVKLEDKDFPEASKEKIMKFRRMKDFDGDWSINFDSAMIGNVVENNEILYDGRTNFNVKDANNLLMISYSEISKENKNPLML